LDRKSILVRYFIFSLYFVIQIVVPSISNTKSGGAIENQIAKALTERIIRAAKDGQRFKVHFIQAA